MEWSPLLPNPYSGKVICDPQRFFNRHKLLKNVFSLLAARQSISLVGPPRIGKSSFLSCLHSIELQKRCDDNYEHMLQHHLFIYVDLLNYSHVSWDVFFAVLSREIIIQCQNKVKIKLRSDESSSINFSDLIEQIVHQGYCPNLLLDSFEVLRDNDDLAFAPSFLRSHAPQVAYVVASSIPLFEIFPEQSIDSPFFNIFTSYTLASFMLEETLEFIDMPVKSLGLSFSKEEVEWVLKQAGGHPLFLQWVCAFLFETKSLHLNAPLNFERIENRAYQELQSHCEIIWKSLNERQQEVLQRDVLKYKTRQQFLQQKEPLELSDSALFRRFVHSLYQAEQPAIGESALIKALKNLDRLMLLGKSPLCHLKVIEKRIEAGRNLSVLETGTIVRDILFKALERLQGVGIRQDSSPEWLFYNILYYNYFKHNNGWSNEHIAARLGMSERNYYRLKKEAIQALLLAIVDIEKELY
ncbi:MAG TPA: hypothetical protein VF458_09035 [Ktedonobacteraceae bacterium]